MKIRNVILDCDPGIDDAFAIAIALKAKELNVLAIHTVAGNVSVEHTTRNARGLVHLLKKEVAICKGAVGPLTGKAVIAADIHGNNGFAGYEFSDDALAPLSPKSALQSYYDLLTAASEPVDIIAVGPLTNVAILLMAYPHLKAKIGVVSIMGGGLTKGNITAAAEFNFYADPEAAQIVFQSGLPIIMAGLDVTEKARFYEEDVQRVLDGAGELGKVLHTIVQPTFARKKAKFGVASTQPNDVCSVLVLFEEGLFEGKRMKVSIETGGHITRGMSVGDQRSMNPEFGDTLVLLDVDEPRFRDVVCRRLIGE